MLAFRLKSITSRQNAIVRTFRELRDTPDPSGMRLLLDGPHLVRDARRAGAAFEAVAVPASHLASPTEEGDLARALERDGVEVLSASEQVFAAMSPVRTPSGIVAIARRKPATVDAICGAERAFILAAVDVQDPGNLGSLIRVAEAGGMSGVLVCGGSANPFSWKSLRGSMGSALRLPIVSRLSVDDALRCARRFGARTVATLPKDGRPPEQINWSEPIMLLLGGEGSGLPDDVVAAADERVTIPMAAPVESLNVAVAGAILIYAAQRNRPLAGAGRHRTT
jgi:TrmH family RNA methyltransferase